MAGRNVRIAVGFAAFALAVWQVPHRVCARHADSWLAGDLERAAALADGVDHWVADGVRREQFDTGHALFDSEWMFGTYMMAAMGYGQCALADEARRDVYLERMDGCLDALLTEDVRQFDTAQWDRDALSSLARDDGHVAYLGYFNLALALRRHIADGGRHEALHERITEALARRLAVSPIGLVETYPGEVYPVDNCAAIASVQLHAATTGADHAAVLRRCKELLREKYIDLRTGLLVQAVDVETGERADSPRGSGTFLGSYFLSFGDPALARELYEAGRDALFDTVIGFGAMREYARGVDGRGDIDSGPIVFGFGVSATGFALGPARTAGDGDTFSGCLATATFFGAPHESDGTLTFLSGGPLGDAILFAMLTATRAEESR